MATDDSGGWIWAKCGLRPQINPARPTAYVGPTHACLVTQWFLSGVESTVAYELLRSDGGELATRHVDFCSCSLGRPFCAMMTVCGGVTITLVCHLSLLLELEP
jgi:hypothetical protein